VSSPHSVLDEGNDVLASILEQELDEVGLFNVVLDEEDPEGSPGGIRRLEDGSMNGRGKDFA
jgi:hypothetical protein